MKTQSQVLAEGRTYDKDGIVCPSPYEVGFFNNDCGLTRYEGNTVFSELIYHSHNLSHLIPIIRKDEKINETLTFGVELEYDEVGRQWREFMGDRMKSHREENPYFMIKGDGSLNSGLEAVTQPFSYSAYAGKYASLISAYITQAKKFGAKATSNCGLHVHIDKKALGEKATNFLIEFLWNNKSKAEFVAGRESNNYCRWREPAGRWNEVSVSSQYSAKYSVINLSKEETVEFRLNKGSSRISTVLARIEFVMALAEFAKDYVAQYKFGMPDWDSFKDYVRAERFPHLHSLLSK